jgi:ABC-type bacteriocin/lantibiotic exporter with double-glycine peptidase domain
MKIPFFGNLPDDVHCMQACMKMILKYYFPNRDFSFKQIDKLIGLEERRLWSNPVQAAVVLHDLGLKVKFYTACDVKQFLKEGAFYIKKNYKDWKTILSHLDVNLVLRFTQKALERGLLESKKLSWDTTESFFKKGNLIMLVINTNVFKDRKGYAGHFVLLTNIGKQFVEFHDPGLPPIPNRREDKRKFIQSWYDPDTDRNALVCKGRK